MDKKRIWSIGILLAVVVLNIGCDQVTKDIARKQLEYGYEVEVIGNYLILVKVENTGAFLGMGSEMNDTLKVILLNGLPLVVLLALMGYVFYKKDLSIWLIVAIAFIVGGGIGNIIDRFLYGSVTDFMHIDLVIARTGVFNMADVSVMVGTGMLLVDSLRKPKVTEEAETTT